MGAALVLHRRVLKEQVPSHGLPRPTSPDSRARAAAARPVGEQPPSRLCLRNGLYGKPSSSARTPPRPRPAPDRPRWRRGNQRLILARERGGVVESMAPFRPQAHRNCKPLNWCWGYADEAATRPTPESGIQSSAAPRFCLRASVYWIIRSVRTAHKEDDDAVGT